MAQGLIQYATDAKDRRKNAMKNMFLGYVDGFVNHAYEITRECPACRKNVVKAEKVWVEQTSVKGAWRCGACGCVEKIEVPFASLVEDFNAARKSRVKFPM